MSGETTVELELSAAWYFAAMVGWWVLGEVKATEVVALYNGKSCGGKTAKRVGSALFGPKAWEDFCKAWNGQNPGEPPVLLPMVIAMAVSLKPVRATSHRAARNWARFFARKCQEQTRSGLTARQITEEMRTFRNPLVPARMRGGFRGAAATDPAPAWGTPPAPLPSPTKGGCQIPKLEDPTPPYVFGEKEALAALKGTPHPVAGILGVSIVPRKHIERYGGLYAPAADIESNEVTVEHYLPQDADAFLIIEHAGVGDKYDTVKRRKAARLL